MSIKHVKQMKRTKKKKSKHPREGQVTMVVLLLVVVVFIGMGAFLFSLGKQLSQSEYLNVYVHDLLSSILKTDTGLTDPSCKTTADVVTCAFLTPTHMCGDDDCFTLANRTVSEQMNVFIESKQGFRFLLTVQPNGFVALPDGVPYTLQVGDPSVAKAREKFRATERIQQVVGGNPYLLDVTATIAKR